VEAYLHMLSSAFDRLLNLLVVVGFVWIVSAF
jgi:hypothetical protein